MAAERPLTTRLPDDYTVETADSDRFNRYRFTVYRDSQEIGQGTHFCGGNHIRPWIELQPAVVFSPDSTADRQLFNALTDVVRPGSHLMVHYLQDAATAAALTADVPPPATPLGFLLWQAGVRWFKDWYFTEGWMEGDQKLQGNLPVDAENKAEQEAEWCDALQGFATDKTDYTGCQRRAVQLLETL